MNSLTESSVQQSNCSKEAVCGSVKNKASDATVQQNDNQQPCFIANRNILHIADTKRVVVGREMTMTMTMNVEDIVNWVVSDMLHERGN